VTVRGRSARVMSEVTSLAASLPVNWASSILVRADETRPDHIKALIVGPEDTPYQNGLFEFDILLGPSYPSAPPSVQLITTGRGTIRFNPNLYECGKVCLSLLGTWAGPGWDPATSTILQVLVSIQALILVKDPFFNEPGFEGMQNTPQGKAESTRYNRDIRKHTLQAAILEHISGASNASVFQEVMALHFLRKRSAILKQLLEWEKSTPGTVGLCKQIRAALSTLREPGAPAPPAAPESASPATSRRDARPRGGGHAAENLPRAVEPEVDLT